MSLLDLSCRRIFVTGGTGFVGRTLLDYLISWRERTQQPFEVTVLSRQPARFLARYVEYANQPWLSFVPGSLSELPAPGSYTDVIHAAADTHLQEQGALWIDQIVNGTAAVLDFAVKSGAKRFLHTSSGAIYGPQPADVTELSEDHPGAPSTVAFQSVYGQAKRVAEQLCTVYYHEHGLHTVNARCFAFAGKHLPLDGPYALGNFIRDALQGDAIRVKGDGTAVRSYLDGEDMARWLLALLDSGQGGQSYNVGSDKAVSMKKLAQVVAGLLAPGKSIVVENAQPGNTHRSRYIPCIRKAAALGLVPTYSLEQAISRSVEGCVHHVANA